MSDGNTQCFCRSCGGNTHPTARRKSNRWGKGHCPGLLLGLPPPTYLPQSCLSELPWNANPRRSHPAQSPSRCPHGRNGLCVPCVLFQQHQAGHLAGTTPPHPPASHFLCSFPPFITPQTLIHPFKPTSIVSYSVMPVPTPTGELIIRSLCLVLFLGLCLLCRELSPCAPDCSVKSLRGRDQTPFIFFSVSH